jgi:hypothetical protein
MLYFTSLCRTLNELPTEDPHTVGTTTPHSSGTNLYQNIRSAKAAARKAKTTVQEYEGPTQKLQRQYGRNKQASTFILLLYLEYRAFSKVVTTI